MRILVASDLHYRLPHYDWLLEQALQFDVVALPGDHLDVAGAVPLDAPIVVLQSYFDRLSSATVLLTTSGNHDLDEHVERACVTALLDEDLTGIDRGGRQVGTIRQQPVHGRERRRERGT